MKRERAVADPHLDAVRCDRVDQSEEDSPEADQGQKLQVGDGTGQSEQETDAGARH